MKQVNLTITFDEEKLSEKYVPAPVREYIDESDASAAAPSKPRRGPRAAAPKPDEEPEVSQ